MGTKFRMPFEHQQLSSVKMSVFRQAGNKANLEIRTWKRKIREMGDGQMQVGYGTLSAMSALSAITCDSPMWLVSLPYLLNRPPNKSPSLVQYEYPPSTTTSTYLLSYKDDATICTKVLVGTNHH